ncbi:MAG: hypothetical protein LUH82_07435 [Clostridiales bacterium]|nr:hypothetical protein [Clostridiales bacterium]
MKELVEYDDSFGTVNYPEKFEKLIEGLPVSEQLKYFRMGCGTYLNHSVKERRKSEYDYSCNLEDDNDVKSIIVKDEKIAGVMVKDVYGDIYPCMVEKGYIIRDDDELDGSGYKSFVLYSYLICVPADFDTPSAD